MLVQAVSSLFKEEEEEEEVEEEEVAREGGGSTRRMVAWQATMPTGVADITDWLEGRTTLVSLLAPVMIIRVV